MLHDDLELEIPVEGFHLRFAYKIGPNASLNTCLLNWFIRQYRLLGRTMALFLTGFMYREKVKEG